MYGSYAQRVLLMEFCEEDKVEPVKTEQISYVQSPSNTRKPRGFQNCV
jgi:hypothetical protein